MSSPEFFSGLFASSAGTYSAAAGAAEAAAASTATTATAATSAATYAGYSAAALSALSSVAGARAMQANAGISKFEAEQAKITGNAEMLRTRRENINRLSTIRSTMGSQGTTMEGSPMLAYLDSVKSAALNEQDALYGGALKAQSKKFESNIYSRMAGGELLRGGANVFKSLGSTMIS